MPEEPTYKGKIMYKRIKIPLVIVCMLLFSMVNNVFGQNATVRGNLNVSGTVTSRSFIGNAATATSAGTVTAASLTNTIPIAQVVTPGQLVTNGNTATISLPGSVAIGTNATARIANALEVWGTNTANPALLVSKTNLTARVEIGSSANIISFWFGAGEKAYLDQYGDFAPLGDVASSGNGTFAGYVRGVAFYFNTAGTPRINPSANGIEFDATTLGSPTNITVLNVYASGTAVATNGVVSNSRRLLAPVSISVTGSPFNWTNSSAGGTGGTNNVFVFIDGSGVTGSVGLNGTTIFSALVGADATVPLQPGEYVTVTYSIGTPVMTWKPF